ncbi:MAG: methyltransferase [Desulfosalsimonadaceae bacterium]
MAAGLHIQQPPSGYRFSIDALILAWHLAPEPGDRVVDIGTGCGVIALILASRWPGIQITGIEIQEELAALAADNAERNGLSERIRILRQDLRDVSALQAGPADRIVCNPPHTARASGRINPKWQLALARHEIAMTAADLLAASSRLLKPGGRLLTIYPAARRNELLEFSRDFMFAPRKERMLHFKPEQPADRFLLEVQKQPAKEQCESVQPLFLQDCYGSYTREARDILDFAGVKAL